MAEKPGVMLYFDMAESLKFLSREDKGDLLDAIMDYGRMGKQPDFQGALGVCWALIKPRMDRDTAKYEEVVIKKQYSSYCAALKRKSPEEIPLPYEDWLSVRNHPDAGGTARFPTTISTPSTNKKSYLSTTSAPSITTKTERNDPGVDFEKLRQQKLEQLKSASFFTPPTLEEVSAYCKENNYIWDPQRFYNFYESNGWMVGQNKMQDWKAACRTWESRERKPNQSNPTSGTDRLLAMIEYGAFDE